MLILKFLPPMALWCFLYRGFFWGDLRISEDTFYIYGLVKFFLANLSVGIFPHWNPYMDWGMANVCQIGEFNPIWLFTYALSHLGLDFYHAFVWTIALYMFLAFLGVYALLRRILGGEFWPYLGAVLFLFSSAGMSAFIQLTFLFVFTPSVWFFYFLARFYQRRDGSSVVCLGFSLMIILTTYIPFYFITAFLCFMALVLVFYFRTCSVFLKALYAFARAQAGIFWFTVAMVAASALISALNWLNLRGDFVSMARPAVIDYSFAKDSGIPIAELMRDTSLFHALIEILRFPMLSHAKDIFLLSNIAFDNQRMFYVPVLAHLMIFVRLFSYLRRRTVFWGLFCFFLILIAVANLTPVHAYLFNHVPFFKVFRNIFFLIPFIVLLYILLGLDQFQAWWTQVQRRNYWNVLWAGALMGAFVLFCRFLGHVPKTSYITALGFLLLTGLRFTGILPARNRFGLAVLLGLAVIQPIEVFAWHATKFRTMETPISIVAGAKEPLGKPVFYFSRPHFNRKDYEDIRPNDIYRLFSWHTIAMKDAAGFITFNYGYVTPWSYALAKSANEISGFGDYIQRKFWVYDQFNADHPFDSVPEFGLAFDRMDHSQFIEPYDQAITIERFNANQLFLTTRFPKAKFLVYNDSYHPQWKVSINGQPTKLYRANFAFKGLWVPGGVQKVRFEFEPLGGSVTYRIILGFFYLCFMVCLVSLVAQARQSRA